MVSDPAKIGRDTAELAGIGRRAGVLATGMITGRRLLR